LHFVAEKGDTGGGAVEQRVPLACQRLEGRRVMLRSACRSRTGAAHSTSGASCTGCQRGHMLTPCLVRWKRAAFVHRRRCSWSSAAGTLAQAARAAAQRADACAPVWASRPAGADPGRSTTPRSPGSDSYYTTAAR
jgi:hypothetical protein